MALVHVPRAEFYGRRERRAAKRARRRRVAAWGSASLAGLAGAALMFFPLPFQDPPLSGAVDAGLASTTTTALPPAEASTLPEPVSAVTATTAVPWVVVPVETPGWRGDGQLVTDGQRAPLVFPGSVGRSVVVAPVDPTPAATVNVAGRQWRVITRGQLPADGLGLLVGPQPAVPTIALVSSLAGATRPWVEAR